MGTETTQELVITIGIKELLEAGVHFGHQTRRWNPKMKKYIFDARNGIHIIDLSKTLTQLEAACNFLEQTVSKGGKVLFVGTKKQAQQAVKEAAETCGQPYVVERWLGGTLTNLKTIKRSLGRLKHIEQLEADGSISGYVKQEQSSLRREAARLYKNLGGIRTLDNHPDAVFIVDIKREHNAVAEARRLKVPIVALVDTNCDPDIIDLPIAGNDDAIRSVRLVLSVVVQAITRAKMEFEAKFGRKTEQPEASEATSAPAPAATEAPAASDVAAPVTTPETAAPVVAPEAASAPGGASA